MNLTLFGDPQGSYLWYNRDKEYSILFNGIKNYFNSPGFNKSKGIDKLKFPSWVYKALKEGKVVDINEVLISDDYAIFRGKSYDPIIKENKDLKWDRICVGYKVYREKAYSVKTEWIHPVSGKSLNVKYSSSEDVDLIMSNEELNKFKVTNPLPKDRYVIIPGVDQKVIIDKKLDSIDINKGIVTYKFEETVETKAVFFNYSYRYSEEKGLFIDSNPDIYDKEISNRTFYINKRIVKIELSRSYVKTDTYKYESEDGMRMCSDTTSYDVYLYKCTLEDGSFVLYETINKLNI